jgi:hypothetical protein
MDTTSFAQGFIYGYIFALALLGLFRLEQSEWNTKVMIAVESVFSAAWNSVISIFKSNNNKEESIPSDEDSQEAPQPQTPELIPSDECSTSDAPRHQLVLPPAKEVEKEPLPLESCSLEFHKTAFLPLEMLNFSDSQDQEEFTPSIEALQEKLESLCTQICVGYLRYNEKSYKYTYNPHIGNITVWDAETGRLTDSILGMGQGLPCVRFCDGHSLILSKEKKYPISAKYVLAILLDLPNFFPSEEFYELEEKILSLPDHALISL